MINICFVGSREGMTEAQRAALVAFLEVSIASSLPYSSTRNDRSRAPRFHHTSTVGAEEMAGHLAFANGFRVIIHPAKVQTLMVTTPFHERREPKPYPERDENLVLESDMLIAVPGTQRDRGKSLATSAWGMVRRARLAKRLIILILPDGTVQREDHRKKEPAFVDTAPSKKRRSA